MLVREVSVRSALTRSRLFDYCVNPYAGCANACVYCYARFATRFSHPGEEWGSYVDVRINAPSVLRRDLSRARPGTVYMSSVCDAWQAQETEYGVTRQCLQLILDAGFPLFMQTKNALIERDFDLLKGKSNLRLGVTVTTVDERAARLFEPGASTPTERLRVLAAARGLGIQTFVFLGPLLPGISDRGEGLHRLFSAIGSVGPDAVFVDRLNRRAGMWPAVSRAVQAFDSSLLAEFRSVVFAPEQSAYESALRQRVSEAAASVDLYGRIEWCF